LFLKAVIIAGTGAGFLMLVRGGPYLIPLGLASLMIAFIAMMADFLQLHSTTDGRPSDIISIETDDIASLNMSGDLLTHLYKQALSQAHEKYPDPELSGFYIDVTPYSQIGSKIYLSFELYSEQQGRTCHFYAVGRRPRITYSPPDKVAENKVTFNVPPWQESPHWLQFIQYGYAQIGPLPAIEKTAYRLYVRPWIPDRVAWSLHFDDGVSGQEYDFEWNGKEIDDENIT
jgi:hypothetical protein